MTSAHVPAPGVIALGSSRILTLWLAFSFALASALSLFYLPLWAAACIALTALMSAAPALRLHALKSHPEAVVALRCSANGMDWRMKSGRWRSGCVLPGALVSPWLTVARVREERVGSKARYLILLPDCIDHQEYRRLRVFLRWMPEVEKG